MQDDKSGHIGRLYTLSKSMSCKQKIGKTGICRETDEIVVARAALHRWEEPCISGKSGSGAVFFSGCPVGCVYCQNAPIAKGERGKVITMERLLGFLWSCRKKGLRLPVVYNTSGYEAVETIQMLEGIVDIYLPDMKYADSCVSGKYSNAEDYFYYVSKALEEMVRQASQPIFDESGMMQKGVIVRHLLLPGQMRGSKRIIKYLHETYGSRIYLSILNQFTPMSCLSSYPELNRKIKKKEYDRVVDYAIELGVENGFIQEGTTASESFIPAFNEEGV